MSAANSAIILLSGGLDSACNLAIGAKAKIWKQALFIRYGQRAQIQEEKAATDLCNFYGVGLTIVDQSWLANLDGGALTDFTKKLPELAEDQLDSPQPTQASAKAVWVPNRNGLFLNVAATFAESLGIKQVYVGFNKEEAATFPDNSEEFMKATNRALQFSTQNGVEICSFTAQWDKKQIMQEGKRMGLPTHLLWSCYEDAQTPCGKCESCLRFKRAQQI